MPEKATPVSEPPAAHLRRLWERMVGIYGHTWNSAHGLSPQDEQGRLTIAGDTWSKALTGLSPSQLAAGLEACIAEGEDFPPAAGRFRAMCLGIPTFAQVRVEATVPDAERSPFTRSVWQFLDAYAFRQASSRDGEKLLREAYEAAREARMRGAPLPGRAEAITQQKPIFQRASEEYAAQCQEEIARELGVRPRWMDEERAAPVPAMSDTARELARELDARATTSESAPPEPWDADWPSGEVVF